MLLNCEVSAAVNQFYTCSGSLRIEHRKCFEAVACSREQKRRPCLGISCPFISKIITYRKPFCSSRWFVQGGVWRGKSIKWRRKNCRVFFPSFFGKTWIELFNLNLPGVKCAGITILSQPTECLQLQWWCRRGEFRARCFINTTLLDHSISIY